jgi:hypothetical protein
MEIIVSVVFSRNQQSTPRISHDEHDGKITISNQKTRTRKSNNDRPAIIIPRRPPSAIESDFLAPWLPAPRFQNSAGCKVPESQSIGADCNQLGHSRSFRHLSHVSSDIALTLGEYVRMPPETPDRLVTEWKFCGTDDIFLTCLNF